MTSIVREIGRSFLVSCFLPAFVFLSLSKQFFFPVFFSNCQLLGFLVHSDFEQTITFVAVASAFIGYLLWSLNPQLVKLFEGYHFQPLLRTCEKHHNDCRTRMLDEADKARSEYDEEQDDELSNYRESQFITKQAELETFYPIEGDVMPTAIGNVFRAFEQYPGRRYGIDAVLFWPHLISVVKPELARLIEEANNALTFLLTSCLMCSLICVESLVAMLKLILFPAVPYVSDKSFLEISIPQSPESCFYGFFAFFAFVLALALKNGALKASISFGEIVKSCFDLFHQDLLREMISETALADERAAWRWLQRSILVNKGEWPSKWKNEEQRKIRSVDKPASRSRPEPAFVWA